MGIRRAVWAALLALVPSLLAVPVVAQSQGQGTQRGQGTTQGQGTSGQRGQPATGQQTPGQAATGTSGDVTNDLKAAGRALTQAFRDARDKLRQTREERRREERKDARDRWGALLTRTDVRDELRLHARRMARLDYIEKLSDDLDQDKIQDRAKRARDLENDRFTRKMASLKAQGGAR